MDDFPNRLAAFMDFFASSKLAHTAVGSVFGSLVRVVLAPERSWQLWVTRVGVGAISAVFIGGGMADMMGMGTWGFAMMGFVVGTSAEQVLAAVQRRLAWTISGEGPGEEAKNSEENSPEKDPDTP